MEVAQLVGTALVVGIIGPAFWLVVNLIENKLTSKGFILANFDLFSLESWRRLGKIRLRRDSTDTHESTPKVLTDGRVD